MNKKTKTWPIVCVYKKLIKDWNNNELRYEFFNHLWKMFKTYCTELLFKKGIDDFDLTDLYGHLYLIAMETLEYFKKRKNEKDITRYIKTFFNSSRNLVRNELRFYFKNGQKVLTMSDNQDDPNIDDFLPESNELENIFNAKYKFWNIMDVITTKQREVLIYKLCGLSFNEIAKKMKMDYRKICYLFNSIKDNRAAMSIYLDAN